MSLDVSLIVGRLLQEKLSGSESYELDLLLKKRDAYFIPSKKVKARVRLHLEGGKATPAPPVAPALSQHKVKNIMNFCKDFNAATKDAPSGVKLPVDIFVFEGGELEFHVLNMAASDLIKQKAGITKGSALTGREKTVGSISIKDLFEIAEYKFNDMNAKDILGAVKILMGTAKSLNIDIVE
ncbi:MAG: 50S ribosomal protein L11 [Alphaproteobacteria bacterium]|nr:MAG: 50S ribosomal protein L11 [Alphaproteobacteria bacterium]